MAHSWRSNTLLVVGAIAFPLLAGEGACRLAGYRGLERYRPDSLLGWVPVPGQRTATRVGNFPVVIDADGFRGPPLERPKPARTYRLYALGASTTFGWGSREADTYHQVLARMLNDTARARGAPERYEVVNAGVIGYNLRQAVRYLRRIAGTGQPDGFILAYTFNDGWNRFGGSGAPSLGRVLAGVRVKNLLRRSALYDWLVDALTRRRYAAALARGPGAAALAQTGDGAASAADLAAFRAALDSTIAFARDARLALAVLVPAARGQGAEWPRQLEMARAAASAGVPLLDLASVPGPAGDDSLYLPGDAVHPSRQGHTRIARLLYGRLCAAAHAAGAGAPAGIYRPGCGAAPRP